MRRRPSPPVPSFALVLSSLVVGGLLVSCGGADDPVPAAGAAATVGTGAEAAAASSPGDGGGGGGLESAPPAEDRDFGELEVVLTSEETGEPLANLSYEVFWQDDAGPNRLDGVTGPNGVNVTRFTPGSILRSVRVHPTGPTAPLRHDFTHLVAAGERYRLELAVPRAGVVSGVVLDENGDPVPDAQVAAFHRRFDLVDGEEVPAADTHATTGADGTFRLGGFPEGPFVLEAGKEQRLCVRRLAGSLRKGQVVEGVELLLEPGHAVYGQVTGPDGEPVGDARVVAGQPGRRQHVRPGPVDEVVYLAPRPIVTRSDADGLFVLPLVPEGRTWNLNVDHPSYRRKVVTLDPGAVDVWVELDRGAVLRGFVHDALGQPVKKAAVLLLGGPSRLPTPSTLTRADGSFELAGLDGRSGRWLVVSAREHAPVVEGPVDLAAGGLERNLVLPEAMPLEGIVTDAEGRPLSGVAVTARWRDAPEGLPEEFHPLVLGRRERQVTGAAGAFSFDGESVAPGTYDLLVEGPGGVSKRVEGVVPGADPITIVLP